MSHHSTGSFAGLRNTTIFTQQWTPESNTRAIILLVHGYAEHSSRYAHVAEHFNSLGYAVYALDLRGHGNSGGKPVAVTSFDDYVTDVKTYFDYVTNKFPQTPIILYGHSMGSLISLLFALKWQDKLAGLITTGTALYPAGDFPFASTALNLAGKLIPDARLVPALDAAGISHDPAVVNTYVNDQKVHGGAIRVRTAGELIQAAHRILPRLHDIHIPYLAVHGTEDPLCDVKAAHVIREKAPQATTTVKLFEGMYHEVHNEPDKDIVLETISDWIAELLKETISPA